MPPKDSFRRRREDEEPVGGESLLALAHEELEVGIPASGGDGDPPLVILRRLRRRRREGERPTPEALVTLASALYRIRRLRDGVFADGLFADPAWDALLDLYVAERTGRKVSITSGCIAASAPCTTALRWLRQLGKSGLVDREQDPLDGRRAYLRLTAVGLRRMENILEEAHRLLHGSS